MNKIYQKTYKERKQYINHAEIKCEEYLKSKNISFVHFGWTDEIKNNMDIFSGFLNFDNKLRKQPDFLIYNKNFHFIECKSFDNQDFFRLKECDKDAYKYWNYFIKLYLFIYSHKKNIYKIIELNKLLEILPDCITEKMPDNKQPYKLIPLNKLYKL